MGTDLQVTGIPDVKAALARLDARVQERALRASLRAAGEVMQAAETAAAPVRPDLPSGTALPPGALKSDVTLRVQGATGQLMAVVQPGKFTFRFARWVEYGHRLVKGGRSRLNKRRTGYTGPGREIGVVKAHPYIRPAFESSATASVQAFVGKLIEQLKGRI